MDINDWYVLMQFIINKNQQGYLPPSRFNIVINQGSRAYQSYLLGSFQQYTPGRPISRVELGNNRTVRQRLAPTIYGYNLAISPYGASPYPADFLQVDAMWSIYGISIYSHKRIRYAEQNALDSYYNSVIDPITTNPIYLLEDTYFQFYPENQYTARLHYVRDVPEMVWASTPDVNNRPIYDAVNSVQSIWDDLAMGDIVARALLLVGINLQAQQVIAYSNELKQQGQ
jgi:hypothetical protein